MKNEGRERGERKGIEGRKREHKGSKTEKEGKRWEGNKVMRGRKPV